MFLECFHSSIVSAELESPLTCTAVSQEARQWALFLGMFKSLAHD